MPEASTRSLRDLIRKGAAWSTLDVVITRTFSFAIGVLVARLLSPADFGIYAVAIVVHSIVINVSDLNVGGALVRDDTEQVGTAAPTVATISLMTSVVLGTLMAVGAPFLAQLLGEPSATTAIRVMAISLPLAGLSAVPGALLRRHFRMDRMFIADAANTVVTAVVVIVLALRGWGPMALAWSYVAGQVLTTIVILAFSPVLYRPGWDRGEARRLLRFGLPLAGGTVIGFTIQNADYIVVGRMLGAVPLGLYLLAFNISGWPLNVFSSVVRSVSLPGFSRLREGGEAMPEHFASALRLVSRITFPVCLFLGALARPLILTVYGDKWAGASKALIGLAIFAACRTVIELFSDFLVSLGRTRPLFTLQLPWLAALVASLIVLVGRFGIAGAGAAHALVASFIVLPMLVHYVSRERVPPSSVAGALLPSFGWAGLCAVVAGLVAWGISMPPLACAIGGATGLAVYVVPYRSEIRRAVAARRERRRHRQAASEEGTEPEHPAESWADGLEGPGDQAWTPELELLVEPVFLTPTSGPTMSAPPPDSPDLGDQTTQPDARSGP